MNSLLKLIAGIVLCLPLTGCASPGYYDPATGMICSGPMYGPTDFMDDIKCKLSKHRAQRMMKHCCNPCSSCDPCNTCNSCDPCGAGGFGSTIPGMVTSGTFSYGGDDGSMQSYPTPNYAPQSSCPTCGLQGYQGPQTYETPQTYEGEYLQESVPPEVTPHTGPATVVPQKISPVPNHGPKGVIGKPAPAPAAEDPMSSVPPALLHAPTVIPSSAQPRQGARPVQWVPAQVH